MYSFEGDFKRRPVQSLGGASKKEHKDALIEKRQEDRQRREDCRRQHGSSLTIQAFYRGSKVRKKQYEIMRKRFDLLAQTSTKMAPDAQTRYLLTLTRYLLFFYSDTNDSTRLTLLSQQMLRIPAAVAEFVCQRDKTTLFQLKRLLTLCCRLLEQLASGQGPIAMPMRMLEVFTDTDTYCQSCDGQQANQIVCHILQHLMHNGYYCCLRVLVERRIPASLEQMERAPTPLAASLLALVRKPLALVSASTLPAFRNAVLQGLCRELLCRPHAVQTRLFLVPSLAAADDGDGGTLHFGLLLATLVPPALRPGPDGSQTDGRPATLGDDADWTLQVDASPWLLWSLLTLSHRQLGTLGVAHLQLYVLVLSKLVPLIRSRTPRTSPADDDSASESDEDTMQLDQQSEAACLLSLHRDCLLTLDSPAQVDAIVSSVLRSDAAPPPVVLSALCIICHSLMLHSKLAVHRKRLLYSLAFNPAFLRNLWYTCISVSKKAVTGEETPLLQLMSRGSQMTRSDRDRIVPLLSLFSSLFSHSLLSLHDSEFYGSDSTGSGSLMPFSLAELVPMSLALRDTCLGVVELAHPDTKPALRDDYRAAFISVGIISDALSADELARQRRDWAYLFQVTVQLVKQLYVRDSRQPFCPPSHWLARQVNIQADKPSQLYKLQGSAFMRRSFGDLSTLNPNRTVDDDCPALSTAEVRNLTILTELPFVVSFQERVKIFQRLVHQDRLETQGEMRHLVGGPSIQIMVRRSYLYEDAFEKLSIENEPNLRLRMQVQLVNFAGLDEAGIDGGGIFREFMSELMKTAFDPNRGFFRHTSDQLLYPNPGARVLFEDFTRHYFFIGRILGKAIYENMLIELPFASFFLSKILSRHRGDVDVHHLASLDPEMYKNLLFLKNFDGDVGELGLNFTVVNNDLGEAQVVELKPGGHDIAVTNSNTIDYIHRMADYRLNKQMRAHCSAFRQGLADVINIEWLRMFDHNEVQLLISGAVVPIDLDDLRQNTNYSGGYTAQHAVIELFWTVVFSFSDTQRRQLLKFVTSCSRPPLLGFKELYPAFCVHHAGSEADRLPTASTCMNLLKLPEFKTEATMRNKLLYALESGAGFELS